MKTKKWMPFLACLVLLFLSLDVSAQTSPALEPSGKSLKRKASAYLEFNSGLAIAHFLPLKGSSVSEHLAENGRQVSLGAGYGWEFSKLRLDAGLKIHYLTLQVSGAYSLKKTDDSFKATYGYLFPTVSIAGVSKFTSKANLSFGLSIGTATFISDKQGQKITSSQIPVFGAFEAGAEISLTDWLKLRPTLSWIPPIENLNVLTPQLGIRVNL